MGVAKSAVVNVLKSWTLIADQNGLDKQCKHRLKKQFDQGIPYFLFWQAF